MGSLSGGGRSGYGAAWLNEARVPRQREFHGNGDYQLFWCAVQCYDLCVSVRLCMCSVWQSEADTQRGGEYINVCVCVCMWVCLCVRVCGWAFMKTSAPRLKCGDADFVPVCVTTCLNDDDPSTVRGAAGCQLCMCRSRFEHSQPWVVGVFLLLCFAPLLTRPLYLHQQSDPEGVDLSDAPTRARARHYHQYRSNRHRDPLCFSVIFTSLMSTPSPSGWLVRQFLA